MSIEPKGLDQAMAEIVGGLFEQRWAQFTDAELPVYTVEFGLPESLCGELSGQTYAQFKADLLAVCQCGGDSAGTTHSHWRPRAKRAE